MTKIIAFDQATKTGWAFGTETERFQFGRWSMPRMEPGERLHWLLTQMIAKAQEFEADEIAYENPWMPDPKRLASTWKVIQLAQKIECLVLLAAAELSLPVAGYASQAWRKTFCGFGRAPKGSPKDFMKRAVFNRVKALGYEVGNFDESDAIGILFHSLHGGPGVERKQVSLLDRLSAGL